MSNETLYIHTQLSKKDLTQYVKSFLDQQVGQSNITEEDSMFFISEITKKDLPKLQNFTKTWAKSIFIKEEMENKIKQDIELYNNYLDFLEENFEKGQFLSKQKDEAILPEKEDNTCPKSENLEDQELNQSP